ncbi:MAG: glycosyltransferase family 39 protein, partial [Bacteroidia bacterium]|nr:glycosyltransferase family 39 protein [Bacteroidia bacterium]
MNQPTYNYYLWIWASWLLLLGLLFNTWYINELPNYIHAWAQADRFALSLGFLRNGFDLFHPETFVLNHQFPGDWKIPGKDSITPIDFPIHHYLIALLMKLFQTREPWVSRVYSLVWSIFGLLAYARLAFRWGNSAGQTLFLLGLAATSPVFVYYQASFLVTIPALATCLLGIEFYFRFWETRQSVHFYLAIVWLTLAALTRVAFVIPLVAFGALEILIAWQEKVFDYKRICFSYFLTTVAIVGYAYYNHLLRLEHGSIFLFQVMPPQSISIAWEIFLTAWKNWGTDFFSIPQYFLFVAIGFWGIRKIIGENQLTIPEKIRFWWLGIWGLGLIFFVGAMLRQFRDHDYYFLDSVYVWCLVFLAACFPFVPKAINQNQDIVSLTLVVPMIFCALQSQQLRHSAKEWERTPQIIHHFRDAEKLLDSLGVNPEAKLLIVDAGSPNLPLLLCNRRGYAILTTSRENILSALKWDYDYLIFQNGWLVSDILNVAPELLDQVKKVGGNQWITVCQKQNQPQTINNWFALLGYQPPKLQYEINLSEP